MCWLKEYVTVDVGSPQIGARVWMLEGQFYECEGAENLFTFLSLTDALLYLERKAVLPSTIPGCVLLSGKTYCGFRVYPISLK